MNKMMMVLALIILLSGNIYADKIVVWNIKPLEGVTDREAGTVTSVLIGEVEKKSKKKIIAESEVRSVIDGEEMKAACGVDDSVCISEIGSSLGAPYSISGTLSKMGDYWIIAIQLIDVKKVNVESRVTRKFKGNLNALVEMVQPAVCELFKLECMNKGKKSTEETSSDNESGISKGKSIAGWTLLGTGVAMGVLGAVSHAKMNSTRDEYKKTGENEETYKKWNAVSLAGYISGGVFIGAGITLLIIDAVEKNRKSKEISLYFYPSYDGFAAGIQGGW